MGLERRRREVFVADKEQLTREVRRRAFLTVGLAAALVFGIIVLVTGDWIPGTIIIAATLIGLGKQVPVIRRLCSEESSPSPPRHKPAH
jgi:predicted tellurium resistance membrane protein TerC